MWPYRSNREDLVNGSTSGPGFRTQFSWHLVSKKWLPKRLLGGERPERTDERLRTERKATLRRLGTLPHQETAIRHTVQYALWVHVKEMHNASTHQLMMWWHQPGHHPGLPPGRGHTPAGPSPPPLRQGHGPAAPGGAPLPQATTGHRRAINLPGGASRQPRGLSVTSYAG